MRRVFKVVRDGGGDGDGGWFTWFSRTTYTSSNAWATWVDYRIGEESKAFETSLRFGYGLFVFSSSQDAFDFGLSGYAVLECDVEDEDVMPMKDVRIAFSMEADFTDARTYLEGRTTSAIPKGTMMVKKLVVRRRISPKEGRE